MRYGQRGGYTPAEQERRECVRLRAAEWFEAGESTKTVAALLRVHKRSVTRWRRAWREGGAEVLLSKGPVSKEKLSAGSGSVWRPSFGVARWPGDTTRTSAGRWPGSRR
ncbi:helix-turn-helix domain-containing protein [Spongiactinospora rosea]|uniref:helix-turn-helix domain-containing protein n=1 Tax=Spongiactinospora rosea TaxID=2248750 RepID=UPI0018F49554